MKNILSSRRFWTLILDTTISLALFFGGKYAGIHIEDIKFAVITLQPIAVLLILFYTVEDTMVLRYQYLREVEQLRATTKENLAALERV